jgi:acyl-CoA synthetase (AMP-forming)/AMP-acid ligase II
MSGAIEKEGIVGRVQPYDLSGMYRGDDGALHYEGLDSSLVEMLRKTVERVPDREAIIEVDGPSVTFREFWDRCARVAGGLRAMGVEQGDRVGNRLPNGLDWCIAFFGSLMAGAIAIPVNTRFAEPEIEYVLTDSGAKFTFMPGERLPDADPYVIDDLGPTDVAAIFYTSGTTGQPKGAMTTHENFLSNIETVMRSSFKGADESNRMLISVPLFHVTGCNSQLLPMLYLGGLTVILPVFDIKQLLASMVKHRTDAVVGTPAIFWLALNQPEFPELDVSFVKWAVYGGAPMPPEQVFRMMEAFPNARLGNGYGMTENSSVATFLPHEYCADHPETVGFAAPNCELKLREETFDSGTGELLMRSSQVVAGYWRKEEQTRQTMVDGWMHSGDVATIDEDGLVSIVDRVKDLINRGGENVYSIEVENAIALHPAVAEVSVVGVPDDMMGEKVGAVVVPREGMRIDSDDLIDTIAKRIADFKLPEYLVVRREPLPRNPGGKIIKHEIRTGTDWGDPLPRRRRTAKAGG